MTPIAAPWRNRSSKFEVPWSYWLCVFATLVIAGVGVSLAFSKDERDRRTGFACSIIFLTFGVGGLIWPILRRREGNGIQTAFVHFFDMHCVAIIFPMSRAKQLITVLGAMFLCVGIATMILVADDSSNRVKGGITLVFYAAVLGLGFKSLLGHRKGIYLVPNGIVWNELFRAPCFVPWSVIKEAALFGKKERHVSKPILSFGLKVSEPALIQTSKWTLKTVRQSKIQHGWDFYFFEETIVAPLPTVVETVQYYLRHPEARSEIGSSSALARIEKIETAAPQQVY